ncbi:PDR/VanB family oxidoreductase [Paeniglutamicibacter cryotolerans]|uniref:Phthalate 4,5-dioxygenase reductase subunit n=1 Tax=Paeniglutamicibacter cryotolerans TaxID=670079 RepID=A0A839QHL2_9MICC|nr:PDR/VanB family oxidoreductase [Paeniglutamicibacter cryotolerans]MBB2995247.1 phthalate 4,5-dioxygenase reductase subunit [Paeniglutamicibacter cryotolerans]
MSKREAVLRLSAKRMLTDVICEFEFRAPDGSALLPFEAGAHLNVEGPSGIRRSYSLTNDPEETDRYVIAVSRDEAGRGGSMDLVDHAAPGTDLLITWPRNGFELVKAERYLFIAGGIGITPIRSMATVVTRRPGTSSTLLYLGKERSKMAYLEDLLPTDTHRVDIHASAERGGRADLWDYLAVPDDGLHVYCCGPAPLMEQVRLSTVHWRRRNIHLEDFSGVGTGAAAAAPFTARWNPTGKLIEVPADRTLLHSLQDAGIELSSSCESGTCGSCELSLLSGEPDHRDLYLEDQERAGSIMPCVSRAVAGPLVLDRAG